MDSFPFVFAFSNDLLPVSRRAEAGRPESEPFPIAFPLQVRSLAFVLVDTTFIRIIGGSDLIHIAGCWGTVFGQIGCIKPLGACLLDGCMALSSVNGCPSSRDRPRTP